MDYKNYKKNWAVCFLNYPLWLNVHYQLCQNVGFKLRKISYSLLIFLPYSFFRVLFLLLCSEREVYFVNERRLVHQYLNTLKTKKLIFLKNDSVFFFAVRYICRTCVRLFLFPLCSVYLKEFIKLNASSKQLVENSELIVKKAILTGMGDALYYQFLFFLLPKRHSYYFSGGEVIPIVERIKACIGATEIQHGIYFKDSPHFFNIPKVQVPLLCLYKETFELYKNFPNFSSVKYAKFSKIQKKRYSLAKFVIYTQPIPVFQKFLNYEFPKLTCDLKKDIKIVRHPKDNYFYNISKDKFILMEVENCPEYSISLTSSVLFENLLFGKIVILDISKQESNVFRSSYPSVWESAIKVNQLNKLKNLQ